MSKKKEKAPKPEAAAGEGGEGGEGAPAKKKLPKMLIIGGVAGLLVLGGGGGAAYFLVLKPKPAAHAAVDEHGNPIAEEGGGHGEKKDEKKEGGHGKAAEGEAKPAGPNDPVIAEGPDGVVYYTPPAFMVNMQPTSQGGKAPLLQVKLTFEMPDQEAADAMTEGLPRINDMMEGFLSELRSEDVNGSQGRVQLKMEILRRANLLIAPQKIKAVNIETLLQS